MSRPMKTDEANVFQKNHGRAGNLYDIPYCRTLRKYLKLFGQDPYQGDGVSNVITTLMIFGLLCLIVPSVIELYLSVLDKDIDAIFECMPQWITGTVTIVKILNSHLNKQNFRKLYELMAEEWELLRLNDELHVLDKVTEQGSKLAYLYRITLLSSLGLFLTLPLFSPLLDIIAPLNETRPRQQLLRVSYLFFDKQKYFFPVYFQLACSATIIVMGIIAFDSLYMIVIHYASGMFAVCGYQVKKATESNNIITDTTTSKDRGYEQLKRCLITHYKALQFYEILQESSKNNYFIQIGLNIANMSATAVQTVLNLHSNTPEEFVRSAIFFGAQQFHLFVISLPGQVLINHCSEFAINTYCSDWYTTSVKMQKTICLMLLRSNKPCVLTAGGLYTMNMENFASAFKMCMSYITMLLSVRE